MSIDTILREADLALAESLQSDEKARLDAMTRFMSCFEQLAREIAKGNATWDAVRLWAREAAERLQATRTAFGDWQLELGRIFCRHRPPRGPLPPRSPGTRGPPR